jgi:hypothetical protein
MGDMIGIELLLLVGESFLLNPLFYTRAFRHHFIDITTLSFDC